MLKITCNASSDYSKTQTPTYARKIVHNYNVMQFKAYAVSCRQPQLKSRHELGLTDVGVCKVILIGRPLGAFELFSCHHFYRHQKNVEVSKFSFMA